MMNNEGAVSPDASSAPLDLAFDYKNDESNLTHPEIEIDDYGSASDYHSDESDQDDKQEQPSPDSPKRATLTHSHEGESRHDHGNLPTISITKSTIVFCMCAAINSCNLGYDIGVSTVTGKLLQEGDMDLTDLQLELLMGSINLFAIFGSLFASTISDKFGRRRGFLVAAIGFIFGVVIMATASNFAVLMFGRVFVGLGVGFGLAIDPLYISELSPACHRGRLVTWSEIATNVGIVLGFSSGLFFYNVDNDVAWRLMFGLGAIMPVCLIFLATFVMPESPRWLVANKRTVEAKQVLEKVYPQGYDIDVIVGEIEDSLKREEAAQSTVGWDRILFPSPAVKRMLLVGLGSAAAQQIVGIDSVQYFLMYIVEEAGVENRFNQIGIMIFLGILKLAVIFVAGNFFDKKGRRPLFFMSLAGMIFALIIIAITFVNKSPTVTVLGLAIYLSFFSLGMGPGAWLIPAEVFSTGIRAKAMSIATFLNRITATIMSSTFLTVAKAISYGGFFILLAFICVAVLIFFYVYLPETKGRSLEDMTLYFAEITGDTSILDAENRIHGTSVVNSPTRQTKEEESVGEFA